ncbi:MAG: LytTR family transcriptional regulator [Bacteroidota bacterium]|nr:LytTR family transcriptional regulator [Bacteroidota bacterium]
MNKSFNVFNESFPLEENQRIMFLQSIIISAVVVVMLFLFQPFGLADVTLPLVKMVPVYIGYGLVTMFSILIADRLVRPAFPSFFDDQLWTVSKHIGWTVFTIMMVGLGNLFYSRLLGFTGISGTSLLTFQLYTFAVSIFPVTVITLLRRIRLLSKNLKVVNSINQSLVKPVTETATDSTLVFNSDNGKDSIRLQADQFLYAESSDNYTDIVYIENSIVRRALIRSSLKRIEEMNAATYVIRVHRAFLVNMLKVKKVTGNSQGYRLIFDNLDETIPVARRVSFQVRDLLAHIHGD